MTVGNDARLIPCVGAIVHDGSGRLLVIRRSNPPAEGMWSIPGGRCEIGETAEQACAREVREETGLEVEVGELLGTVERDSPSGGIYVIDDFRAYLSPHSPTTPHAGDDASDARWATRAELIELPTSAGLIEALTEWNCLPD